MKKTKRREQIEKLMFKDSAPEIMIKKFIPKENILSIKEDNINFTFHCRICSEANLSTPAMIEFDGKVLKASCVTHDAHMSVILPEKKENHDG